MAELQDILMNTILAVFAEKVDSKILKKVDTKEMRKKLLKNLTNEVFYALLNEGRVDLAPGFGSVILKEIKEKDKKIYDRVTKTMVLKHVKGKKVVYKPGDTVREFL